MTEAIKAQLDGLKDHMDTRFAAHERDQAGMVAWMERLSASVDRLVDFGSSLLAIQQRTAAIEGAVSDVKIDIDGLDTRMSDIESNRKADAAKNDITKWGLGATGGAIVAYVVQQLIGAK